MVNRGEVFAPSDRVYWHGRPVGCEWGTVIRRETRVERDMLVPWLWIIFDDAHEEWVPERSCVHDYNDYIPF